MPPPKSFRSRPALLVSIVTYDPCQGPLFPWQLCRRWRKWAVVHYHATRRAYRRALWAARMAYWQAVWLVGIARLFLAGAMTMAAVVDLLTRAQLRRHLGALPVLYGLLEILQVRQIINRHCPTAAEVDHGAVAVVLTLNRLTVPRVLFRQSAEAQGTMASLARRGPSAACRMVAALPTPLRRRSLVPLCQRLHWTLPRFGTPQQAERWSDLMPLITWELGLAREMVADNPLPWQKPQTNLTPGRVCQGMGGVLAAIGTPAQEPKPRGKSPGWPKGRPRKPRERYPVVKKD